MFVVITVSLLALFLTYLENKGLKGGMKLGFVLVTLLSAIHYDYGNDYMSYYSMYQLIDATPFSWDVISNSLIHYDGGWVLINYIFKHLGGFFSLVIVLSIIQNQIIYKFIKREVSSENQTLAVFIYLITTSFYLMSFSMLRQWFVACIFLGCWSMIKERQWIKVFVILYLASFVHGSAKLLLPFAFWGFIPVKNGRTIAILLSVLFILFCSSESLVGNIFSKMESSGEFEVYFDRYANDSSELQRGLGFIIQLIPLFVIWWYLFTNKGTNENRLMILISSLSFLIMPFTSIIPLAGRLSTYFSVYKIAAIPITYYSISNKMMRYSLMSIFIVLTLYDYLIFFSNPTWIEKYSTFKTIFSTIP